MSKLSIPVPGTRTHSAPAPAPAASPAPEPGRAAPAPARSVPGYPVTALSLRAYARVRMPLPWGLWSDDGNGQETWINGNDFSEVWVYPEFHKLIWINPGWETLAQWPQIDSPMGYPSPYSPVECAIPDCVVCEFISLISVISRQFLNAIGVAA